MDKKSSLQGLFNDIFICRKCPNVIPSEAPRRVLENTLNSKIVFMAQAPAQSGVRKSGVHWVKKEGGLTNGGEFLERYLIIIGYSVSIRKGSIPRPYTTNVLHCWTGKSGKWDRSPSKEELKNCRSWWLEEIKIIKPECIVLLGSKAVDSFGKAIGQNMVFSDLINRQGEEKIVGNIALRLFTVPYPGSPYKEKEPPYRTISQIYDEVFPNIKTALSS